MRKRSVARGFTLIELLVVIAIIGLLSSIALASLNSARAKARDARRIADFRQIQTALELFYNSYGAYPYNTNNTSTWDEIWWHYARCLEVGIDCFGTQDIPNYAAAIAKVPQDPLDGPATFSDADPTYYIGWPSGCGNGQGYLLGVFLETNHPALGSDVDSAVPNPSGICDDAHRGFCVRGGTCSVWP